MCTHFRECDKELIKEHLYSVREIKYEFLEQKEDYLQLNKNTEWTLAKGLQAARIITLDSRTLWQCIGLSFIERTRETIDLWNEQLAVKLLHKFIIEFRNSISRELYNELIEYITINIKPRGYEQLYSVSVNTDSNLSSENVVLNKEYTEEIKLETPELIKEVRKSELVTSLVRPLKMINEIIEEGALICSYTVNAFDELLRIPRKQMFYLENVYENCMLAKAIENNKVLRDIYENEEVMLVLCLIYERFTVGVNNSLWKMLLEACPAIYPHIPMFWSAKDLAELEGTDIVDDVIQKREEARAFCKESEPLLYMIYDLLKEQKGTSLPLSASEFVQVFNYETTLWARATFDSRAFKLNFDGNIRISLVPFADMINHSTRSDVLIRKVIKDGGDFVMLVGAPITKEDVNTHRELWMSYGPLQNWELLEHYGFVLTDNEFDKLPFPFIYEVCESIEEESSDCNSTAIKREDDRVDEEICSACMEELESEETNEEEVNAYTSATILPIINNCNILVDNNSTTTTNITAITNITTNNNDKNSSISDSISDTIKNNVDYDRANTIEKTCEGNRVEQIRCNSEKEGNECREKKPCSLLMRNKQKIVNDIENKRQEVIKLYHLDLLNQLWIPITGIPPDALLTLLRITLCTENELLELMPSELSMCSACISPFSQLSNSTEMKIIETIQSVLESWLSSLTYTLEENVANLANLKEDYTNVISREKTYQNVDIDAYHSVTNCILSLQLIINLQHIAVRCLN